MCQCPISGALHFYTSEEEAEVVETAVSMPYLGRTSFLPTIDAMRARFDIDVSMPYLGRTSFLQKNILGQLIWKQVCQCPISGALHFYVTIIRKGDSPDVSMPYLGRTSFLLDESRSGCESNKCVNALSRAHFISTEMIKQAENVIKKLVSMPYLGRTSFLLRKRFLQIRKPTRVNALSRAHFISTGTFKKTVLQRSIVSMPYLGRTSFLQTQKLPDSTKTGCVNALSRAHFISTVMPVL